MVAWETVNLTCGFGFGIEAAGQSLRLYDRGKEDRRSNGHPATVISCVRATSRKSRFRSSPSFSTAVGASSDTEVESGGFKAPRSYALLVS